MRIQAANLAMLALACLLATCLADTEESINEKARQPTSEPLTARARFTRTRLFDFEHYKATFNKRYGSLLEDAARARLFVARAFRAFLSAVSYKQRKASYYLAINQMSDWTPEEVRKIDVRLDEGRPNPMELDAMEEAAEEPVPVASLDDVEGALSEMAKSPANEPAMRLLAEESRRRRDLSERQISLSDIAREPVEERPEPSQVVASNNPAYEPPEQTSFGWFGGPQLDPMPEQVGKTLRDNPGRNFIGWLLNRASGVFKSDAGVDSHTELEQEAPLPDEVFHDHRDECMFEPRNQGRCGSCYAFASIAVYEWLYCKATGRKVAFSEQYIVDCGTGGLNGCHGGYTTQVPDFIREYGLELRAHYPYRQRTKQCPYDQSTSSDARGYIRVHTRSISYVDVSEWEKELKNGPMLVPMYVSDVFHEYGGGVHDGAGCDEKRGHAMVLVGSGREDNQEYWLMRNSYSSSYGEGGYYKLNKQAERCVYRQEAYRLSGFTGYEKNQGLNTRYQPRPIRRRWRLWIPSSVLRPKINGIEIHHD